MDAQPTIPWFRRPALLGAYYRTTDGAAAGQNIETLLGPTTRSAVAAGLLFAAVHKYAQRLLGEHDNWETLGQKTFKVLSVLLVPVLVVAFGAGLIAAAIAVGASFAVWCVEEYFGSRHRTRMSKDPGELLSQFLEDAQAAARHNNVPPEVSGALRDVLSANGLLPGAGNDRDKAGGD